MYLKRHLFTILKSLEHTVSNRPKVCLDTKELPGTGL